MATDVKTKVSATSATAFGTIKDPVTKDYVDTKVAQGGYTLPAATSSTLGGVKAGSGLAVTDDGTLSAMYTLTLQTGQVAVTQEEYDAIASAWPNACVVISSSRYIADYSNSYGYYFTATTNAAFKKTIGVGVYGGIVRYTINIGNDLKVYDIEHRHVGDEASSLHPGVVQPDNTTIDIDSFSAIISVKDGGITSAKLADGAVTSAKLADGAVTAAKVADGAITAGKIADGAITSDKLASGVGGGGKVSGKLANGVIPLFDTYYIKLSSNTLTTSGNACVIYDLYDIGDFYYFVLKTFVMLETSTQDFISFTAQTVYPGIATTLTNDVISLERPWSTTLSSLMGRPSGSATFAANGSVYEYDNDGTSWYSTSGVYFPKSTSAQAALAALIPVQDECEQMEAEIKQAEQDWIDNPDETVAVDGNGVPITIANKKSELATKQAELEAMREDYFSKLGDWKNEVQD